MKHKAVLVTAAKEKLMRALMRGDDEGDELLLHALLDLRQWELKR